jgi:hypothetical protein
MTNDGIIKIPSTLSGNTFARATIHLPILTFYDFNIYRNSCPCYPSKYFRIWNGNKVTVEINFGMGISFLID